MNRKRIADIVSVIFSAKEVEQERLTRNKRLLCDEMSCARAQMEVGRYKSAGMLRNRNEDKFKDNKRVSELMCACLDIVVELLRLLVTDKTECRCGRCKKQHCPVRVIVLAREESVCVRPSWRKNRC